MDNIEILKSKKDMFANVANDIKDVCYGLAKDAGWHDKPREAGTMIALIHSEVSEALEGIRKDMMDDHLTNRKMVEVEMADAIIRIMDFCGKYNFDIGGAIVDKLIYNTTRKDHKKEIREQKGGKVF